MKEFREVAREISLREWIEAAILFVVMVGAVYALLLLV